jgi:hypothetical protein
VRGILVGLLLTAACYAPKVAPGAACADNGLCPVGQTCSAGVCVLAGTLPDAGGDAVAIADKDGDGVADSVDNCPDAKNADQGNDDGDAFGDVCDPCPQLVDTAVADKDGDHIGDACDPNATADVSWLFEGFHGGLPGWDASSGWQVVNDAAQVAAPGDPAPDVEDLALPLEHQGRTFDHFSVTVAVTVTDVSAGTEVAIEYFDDTRNKSIECELAEIAEPNHKRILWLNDELGLDVEMPFAWVNGTQYMLRFTRHGANYTCEILGAGAPTPATGSSTVTPHNGTDFDLWVYGATVRFGSVSVVGPPP